MTDEDENYSITELLGQSYFYEARKNYIEKIEKELDYLEMELRQRGLKSSQKIAYKILDLLAKDFPLNKFLIFTSLPSKALATEGHFSSISLCLTSLQIFFLISPSNFLSARKNLFAFSLPTPNLISP